MMLLWFWAVCFGWVCGCSCCFCVLRVLSGVGCLMLVWYGGPDLAV